MFIKSEFFEKTGFLDENVFLYGEEAILSSKIGQIDGEILFVPYVEVQHLHKKPSKHLYKYFIDSRKYYLSKYKNYNKLQIVILLILYRIIYLFLKFLKKKL